MLRKFMTSVLLCCTLLCGFFAGLSAGAAEDAEDAGVREQGEVRALAKEAFVYGFPLVLMDVTKWNSVALPDGSALVNRFVHARAFADAADTTVVSPNADTLYSTAWLDLGAGPTILELPEVPAERYYVMQCLDAWTNVFASIGTRVPGNGAGAFFFTPPGWSGNVPAGMTRVPSPTKMVWIIGRTETNGEADYAQVHALQDRYLLRQYDPAGKVDDAPADRDTATIPLIQLLEMEPQTFYERLNALMGPNPPAAADRPLVDRIAVLGLAPDAPFDPSAISADVWRGMREGFEEARAELIETSKGGAGLRSGAWSIPAKNTGRFGTDYDARALTAYVGLGANLPEDAIYPMAFALESGETLNGAQKYVVRFEKRQMPPVRAFWSLTLYNDNHLFVDNPLGRYRLGSTDPLSVDEDGSVSIRIQREPPSDALESNWLPAPEGGFNLILRLYWPEEPILNGSWPLPALRTATAPAYSDSSGGCAAGAWGVGALLSTLGLGIRRRKK